MSEDLTPDFAHEVKTVLGGETFSIVATGSSAETVLVPDAGYDLIIYSIDLDSPGGTVPRVVFTDA